MANPQQSDSSASAPSVEGATLVKRRRKSGLAGLLGKISRAIYRARRGFAAMSAPASCLTARLTPAWTRLPHRDEIVVVSANLWHDWPLRRRLPDRLETFACLIESEGANVVMVQEVARTSGLWADRWLADRLGMSYLYSRANGHRRAIGFEEGLAVFARFPVVSQHVRRLEPRISRFVNRLALGAEVQTPFGSLWAFSVHLSMIDRHNAAQVGELQAWVADIAGDRPALIGGDFNTPESAPQIRRARQSWLDTFRKMHPQADGTTHELCWPWGRPLRRHRLDYIFMHAGQPAWNVVEARHLDAPGLPHSDHRAVMARLRPQP